MTVGIKLFSYVKKYILKTSCACGHSIFKWNVYVRTTSKTVSEHYKFLKDCVTQFCQWEYNSEFPAQLPSVNV